MINENINENTQTIINQLFFEKLNISKNDFFFVNNLVLIINDHKTWARIINTMFQHQTQETIVYEKYKWIMSLDVLFHLEMNMIEILLINHYDLTKSRKSINRFHLKTHVEFWDRKKIRSNNWNFHVAQKLILQSYKARVIIIFWIIHKQKIRTSETNDELDRFKSWIDDVFAINLLERVNEIREYLMSFKNFACLNEKLRNHILYIQQVEMYLILKYIIFRNDIDLFRECSFKSFYYFMKIKNSIIKWKHCICFD
jgi:hypothetical protein